MDLRTPDSKMEAVNWLLEMDWQCQIVSEMGGGVAEWLQTYAWWPDSNLCQIPYDLERATNLSYKTGLVIVITMSASWSCSGNSMKKCVCKNLRNIQ